MILGNNCKIRNVMTSLVATAPPKPYDEIGMNVRLTEVSNFISELLTGDAKDNHTLSVALSSFQIGAHKWQTAPVGESLDFVCT